MAIKNKWACVLSKRGIRQIQLAEVVGVNKGTLSAVVNGSRILSEDEFARACDYLRVEPTDIYSRSALNVMYGMRMKRASRTGVHSTRIRTDVYDTLRMLVNRHEYISVEDAVDAAVRAYYIDELSRSIEDSETSHT